VTDREVAPGCARVRTKCIEKTSVGLWGQSRDPRELPGVAGPGHGVAGVLQVSLEALLQQADRTKDVVQVSHCEHVRLYAEHMPMIVSTRMLYHYLSAIAHVSLIS
jgi:hypothetical protein